MIKYTLTKQFTGGLLVGARVTESMTFIDDTYATAWVMNINRKNKTGDLPYKVIDFKHYKRK